MAINFQKLVENSVIGSVIFIESVEHLNLAENTIKTFDPDMDRIYVVNKIEKSLEERFRLSIRENDIVILNTENNLSMAWNKIIKEAQKLNKENVFLVNLDCMFRKDSFKVLLNFAQLYPESLLWSMNVMRSIPATKLYNLQDLPEKTYIIHNDGSFSAFLINTKIIEKVGYFNEDFKPAYFEDDDFLERCWKANILPLKCLRALFYHYIQGTAKHSFSLQKIYNSMLKNNEDLYISIYGTTPNNNSLHKLLKRKR